MDTPLGLGDYLFIAWSVVTALAGVWFLTRHVAHPAVDHPRHFFGSNLPAWIRQAVTFFLSPAPILLFLVSMIGAGVILSFTGSLFGQGMLSLGLTALTGQGLTALTLLTFTLAAPGTVHWAPSASVEGIAAPTAPIDGIDEIRLAGRAFRVSTLLQTYLAIFAVAMMAALLWKGFYYVCETQGQLLPDEPQAVVQMVVDFDWSGSWAPIIAFGLSIVVGAPIAEELAFRGTLYPLLKGWLPRGYAIVLTGLIFGIIHGSLSAFLPLAAFGAVQCIFRDRFGLLTCIGIHMLFNLVTFIWLILAPHASTQF
ncbi:MAG: CPBP family intramembrane metalloprotease [Verrucomicrobia bacterium]|jgi:membrane protease YdiL (CAAX protease family)|nr:CPBP family intramembrane metalloprotease [Verrucomicrobiota bacterium]